eukprot:COSAG01_NODE_2322_length_7910_cov_16.209960_8_plen_329_part_00
MSTMPRDSAAPQACAAPATEAAPTPPNLTPESNPQVLGSAVSQPPPPPPPRRAGGDDDDDDDASSCSGGEFASLSPSDEAGGDPTSQIISGLNAAAAAAAAAPGTPEGGEAKRKKKAKAPKRRYLVSRAVEQGMHEADRDAREAGELSYDQLGEHELRALLMKMGKPATGGRAELGARLTTAVRQNQADRRARARENYVAQAAKFKAELAAAQRVQSKAPEGALAQKIAQQLRDECAAREAATDKTYSWSSQVSGSTGLPDDTDAPQADPDYISVAEALNSIAVPVNTSRGNVKLSQEQVVTGMCIGVVGGRSNGIITSRCVAAACPH